LTSGDTDDKARFLLGLLSEDERARVEQAALADPAVHEELLAAEDELFHDYACGALSDEEAARFEERFLGAESGRQRLRVTRAALASLERRGTARARAGALVGLAAAAVLIVVAWLALRPGPPPPRPIAGAGTPRPGPTSTPILRARPTEGVPSTALLALTLVPATVRSGGGLERATLKPGVSILRLVLVLPATGTPPLLSAEVRASDGRRVFRRGGLATKNADGRMRVVLDLPVDALPEDDYELTLTGGAPAEAVADYTFGVLRD
jgi:hypothetical protein